MAQSIRKGTFEIFSTSNFRIKKGKKNNSHSKVNIIININFSHIRFMIWSLHLFIVFGNDVASKENENVRDALLGKYGTGHTNSYCSSSIIPC